MWMMEDLGVMQAMIDPMKKLSFESEVENISTKSGLEELEIIFVPGTTELFKLDKNKLIINFFKISVDIFGGTGEVTFNGKPFKEGILDLVKQA